MPSFLKPFIVILFLNLVAGGVYGYMRHIIKLAEQTRTNLEIEVAVQARRVKNSLDLREFVAGAASFQQQLNSLFIDKNNTVAFIEYLETLGEEIGVSMDINQIRIERKNIASGSNGAKSSDQGKGSPDTAKQDVEFLRLQLEVSGSWTGVFKMLTLLELMSKAVTVDRTQLVFSGKDWQAAFDLHALVLPEV